MTTKTIAKRFLACFLALAMVISTTPAAFASTAERNTAEPVENNMISTEELGFTISFDDVETYVECGGETVEDGFFRYDGYVYSDYDVTPVSEEFTIGEKNETYFDIYRDGEFDYSFKFEMIPEEEQSVENPWGAGTHKINVNLIYGGEQKIENVGSFDYIIKEIPISGLYFEDITLTEHTNGEIIQEDGGESWYKYNVNQFSFGFSYQDQEYFRSTEGEESDPGFYWEAEDIWYYPTFTTNQSLDNQWTPDNDNCVVTAQFGGHTAEFKVTIESNPITGIAFTQDSYDVIQGTCQENRWASIESEENSEEIQWKGYDPREFVELEVSLANGESVILSGWQDLPSGDGEEEEEEGGESIAPYYETNETYQNQWDTDTTDAKIYAELLGYKAEASVNIVESPVESISVTPKVIIENTNGHFESDEDGNDWWYYYAGNAWQEAQIAFKNGDQQTIASDDFEEEGPYIDYNGKRYYATITSNQDENHWILGDTNEATFSILGVEGTFEVSIVSSPVSEITVNNDEPIVILENTNGYWGSNEDGDRYYYYNPYDFVDSFSVTIGEEVYECEGSGFHYEGEWRSTEFSDTQYYEPWTAGNTYNVKLNILGAETTFQVEIVGSPVDRIEIHDDTPIEILEHSNGGWDEGDYGEYYHYELHNLLSNYTVIIDDEEYVCDENGNIEYNGETYSDEYYAVESQSSENPWTVGNTYDVKLCILGAEETFQVKIVGSPVDRIEIHDDTPIEILEHSHGFWEEGEDGEYYYYDLYNLLSNYTVIINDEEYACDEDGNIEYNGEIYYDEYYAVESQSSENPWIGGNTYDVTLRILGAEETFQVKIVGSPVEEIIVNNGDTIEIIEHTGGDWEWDEEDSENKYYRYYSSAYLDSFSVIIDDEEYKEEDGGIYYNDDWYEADCTTNQSFENPWTAGNVYPVEMSILGEEVTFYVKIVKSPVTSVKINDGKPIEVIENTNGYWDEDKDGNRYFCYYNSDLIDRYSVTIDGKEYQCSEDGGTIKYNGKSYEPEFSSNQDIEHWIAGNTYEMTMSIMGKEVKVPVTIVKTNVEKLVVNNNQTIELIENTGGWWEENEEEYGKVYYYSTGNLANSYEVTIDGTVYKSDEDGSIYYQGKWYYPDIETNQYDEPWTAGNIYEATLSILGATQKFEVKIIESPVESVTINNNQIVEIVEEVNGYWNSDDDEGEGDEYFYYYVGDTLQSYSVTIGGKVYEPNEYGEIVYNGKTYYPEVESTQSAESPWLVGNTYDVTATIMGVEVPYQVKVIPNEIEQIVINGGEPVKVIANTMGHWTEDEEGDSYYRYSPYSMCNTYSVVIGGETYQSGENLRLEYKGITYYPDLETRQYESTWEVGETYIATLTIMGKTQNFEVEIIPSPVKSISVNNPVFDENTGGEWVYDYDDDGNLKKWYWYDNYDKTNTYSVTLSDGTVLHSDEQGGIEYNGQMYYSEILDDQSVDYPWGVGTHNIHFWVLGGVVERQATINCAHDWNTTYTVDKNAVCNAPGIKSIHCKKCPAVKPGSEETFTIPHTPGAAATCTTPQKCTTCPTVLQAALGHNAGDAKVTVKATTSKNGKIETKCTRCSTVLETATIKKASKVTLSADAYTYNGKTKSPKIYVKDSAGKTISSKYYTVSKPSGRKAIGKYTYTVKFKGNYSGTKKLTLTIKPVKPTIQTPKAAKKAITVKWKKGSKSQVTGYQIMVATNSKFTKNKKTATVKGYSKTSYKMTKLKAKTKYYVKVRSYKKTKSGTIYSDWSKVKTIKTK